MHTYSHVHIYIYNFYNLFHISNMSAIFFHNILFIPYGFYSFFHPIEHFEDIYIKVSFIWSYVTTFLEYEITLLIVTTDSPCSGFCGLTFSRRVVFCRKVSN